MAGFYQEFISLRTTEPDIPTLLSALRAQDPTAGIQHSSETTKYIVKKATVWTTPQITFTQNQIDTAPAVSEQLTAQNVIDSLGIVDKAIILTLIDEINILRVNDGLAPRTVQQAILAIRNKAGTL